VKFATILHPSDFSHCSRLAFQLAAALARAHGARLIILHVKQTLGPMVAYGKALAQLQPEEYQEWLDKNLHRFQVPDAAVLVEHRLSEGNAATEILRVAEETGSNVIVMGTHGRTGLKRLVLGSVTEAVLRKARCPVVAVKAPADFKVGAYGSPTDTERETKHMTAK
jgi:nucleotide-binding universal stress UspA family protein